MNPLYKKMLAALVAAALGSYGAVAQRLALVSATTVSGGPQVVRASGTAVYVGNFADATLKTYNVANPTAPVLTDTRTSVSIRPREMMLTGNTLYVLGYGIGSPTTDGTVTSFDLSTPTAPRSIGVLRTGNTGTPTLVGAGNGLVFLRGSSTAGVQVYDRNMTLVTSLGLIPQAISFNGTLAYFANSSSTTVYDFSTPSTPVLVATLPVKIDEVKGNRGYSLNSTFSTLSVYDVSAPLAPLLLGSVSISNGGRLLAAGTTAVFTAGPDPGIGTGQPLRAFDVSTPTNPTLQGSANLSISDLAAEGPYAYTVSGVTSLLSIYVLNAGPTAVRKASTAVLDLFPNPAQGLVTLKTSATTAIVYDLAGRQCLTAPLSATGQLDVRRLAAGYYVVQAGAARHHLTIQ